MIDIYNRLATDLNYVVQLETTDEIEQILLQIKMVLGTSPGDILGEPYFGSNIKKYIFSLGYDQAQLNKIVTDTIFTSIKYDKTKYDVRAYVDFGKDVTHSCDYAVINIEINLIRRLGIVVNL